MSSAAAVRIVVELEQAPGPIAGVLRTGAEEGRRFAGWLELCALLERLRAEPAPGGTAQPSAPAGPPTR